MARQRWSSRTIFLFAAIGSAVGLGNVWRFPYLTYEYGGGAFLIPYLVALLVLGIPLLILEFAIGQKLQKGAVDAFKTVHHRLRGIGFTAVFSGFVVVVYYAAVMAWSLLFFLDSFQAKLPWAEDSSGYFFNNILQISDGIGNIGGLNISLFFALLAVWTIIYLCVRNGVKSVGKVVTWTMPLPLILLGILFIRGITLDGALNGIYYYLRPDFAALLSTEVWLAAASQIFFTLSLGFGIMIAYASFNKETQDITGDAYITSLVNSAISIFAGFVVFAVLGYMASATGVGIQEVVASGPGLAFVVFPQALSLMPFAWFFSALFFLMLLTLGIDSAFSLVESVNTVFADRYSKADKKRIALAVCSVCFLLGVIFVTNAGLYFLDVFDHFVTNFGLVLVGVFQCIAVGWVYGADKLRMYINSVSRFKIGRWWNFLIKWFIPIALSALLVVQFVKEMAGPYEGYPTWALTLGWLSVIVPVGIAILMSFSKISAES
jgi:neurotransmitter:Na+ symporter, NSS family